MMERELAEYVSSTSFEIIGDDMIHLLKRNVLNSIERKQLLIAGIAANVCVESTARDAMQLDYEVVLVSDGITAAESGLLDSTLSNIRLFFGDVRSAGEIIGALSDSTT